LLFSIVVVSTECGVTANVSEPIVTLSLPEADVIVNAFA